ncbi:MAG: OmpA family protein [Saprospiraceae bacterium]|nr:OmpA family protein [Saprospiraceae bacterium]
MRILSYTLCFLFPVVLAAQVPKRSTERLYEKSALRRDIFLQNAARINTPGMEFSPALYLNGMVYVSRYNSGPVDEKTQETFYELFYSELDPNGMPTKPQNFSMEINSQLHEGPVSFNRKGDRMYFTRSNSKQGISRADKKGKVVLKIYEAQKGEYDWENIQELPFNSDKFSCMHPSLSADGKKLFFASDMSDGYGGMDIYFAERLSDGRWSKPINLGSEVNTAKNEVFPFFHESNTLFFSSDGQDGLGGLDIFMIDLSKRVWGKPVNLGEPFNSQKDDLGLVLTEDGVMGYFTSDRDGGRGRDDIYVFEVPGGIKGIELPELQETLVTVYDGAESKRAAGAAIRVFECSEDGILKNEDLYNLELLPTSNRSEELTLKLVRKREEELGDPRHLTDRNGQASVAFEQGKDYLVLVSKPGYVTQEIRYSTKGESKFRPLEITIDPSNCLSLRGVVLCDPYQAKVPNALVRIVNKCDGSEKVVRTNISGVFEYCLPIGCDYSISAEKDGYNPGHSQVSTYKIRGSRSIEAEIKLTPAANGIVKEPIRRGSVIVLEHIYYDFNKSAIRTGDSYELEALAQLMEQYSSMEIELGAHTDCRGAEDYNLQLSLRRAESAKEFLIQRGIAQERVKAIGYGEALPRNRCRDGVECSEEEHQHNRRTEVKILQINEQVGLGYEKD